MKTFSDLVNTIWVGKPGIPFVEIEAILKEAALLTYSRIEARKIFLEKGNREYFRRNPDQNYIDRSCE